MTLIELHQIPAFADLFNDPRFRAALIYMRQKSPSERAASGDEWRGRFDALRELESLKESPKPKIDTEAPKGSRYPNPKE